jgi:hypothetical protein
VNTEAALRVLAGEFIQSGRKGKHMNGVRKTVETDTGTVWEEFGSDSNELVGEVDISRNSDGGRSVVYRRGETVVVNGTVPASDSRTDEQLAKDVVFRKSLNDGSFRPA